MTFSNTFSCMKIHMHLFGLKDYWDPWNIILSHVQNQNWWLKLMIPNLVAKLWKSTNIGSKNMVERNLEFICLLDCVDPHYISQRLWVNPWHWLVTLEQDMLLSAQPDTLTDEMPGSGTHRKRRCIFDSLRPGQIPIKMTFSIPPPS